MVTECSQAYSADGGPVVSTIAVLISTEGAKLSSMVHAPDLSSSRTVTRLCLHHGDASPTRERPCYDRHGILLAFCWESERNKVHIFLSTRYHKRGGYIALARPLHANAYMRLIRLTLRMYANGFSGPSASPMWQKHWSRRNQPDVPSQLLHISERFSKLVIVASNSIHSNSPVSLKRTQLRLNEALYALCVIPQQME
jgi:hypothetical protein